ncbi:MAG: tetratricopeptide repeat protein [Planctomycetota bacterium]|nr:tetratricopeptide repeat protein [Planctomycetota bacterium]
MSGRKREATAAAWMLVALSAALHAGDTGAPGADPASVPAPAQAEAPALSADEVYARLLDNHSYSGAELERARAAIDAALQAEPSKFEWRFARAILKRSERDAAGSLADLEGLAKQQPRNADVYFQIGQSTMATITRDMGFMTMAGVAGDAKDAWERAVEIDPGHVSSLYALAQYQIQARQQGGMLFGSYGAAKKHADTLMKSPDPQGRFWGTVVLGSIAAAKEDWKEMERQFRAALPLAPRDELKRMVLFQHAGALSRGKKDPKAALAVLDEAEALADPTDSSMYFMKAEALRELGDCRKAVEQYERVLAINADATNTRFHIAACYESLGDKQAAILHYDEFVRRFPKDERVKQARASLQKLRG